MESFAEEELTVKGLNYAIRNAIIMPQTENFVKIGNRFLFCSETWGAKLIFELFTHKKETC